MIKSRAILFLCYIFMFLVLISSYFNSSSIFAQGIETTFIVNTSDDIDDNKCDITHCSFREAINAANAHISKDIITFNINGVGYHTIKLTSVLPRIKDEVIIDGYTQPGAKPNTNPLGNGLNTILMIELDGSLLQKQASGILASCLVIETQNSLVRGLAINRCSYGIVLSGSDSKNNVIEGNFLGTDITGRKALPNFFGVFTWNYAKNNLIGGISPESINLISGNESHGVMVDGRDNTVQGNIIGWDATKTANLKNNGAGVRADSVNIMAYNNQIAFNDTGVYLSSNVNSVISGNQISFNRMGIFATGSKNIVDSNEVTGSYYHGLSIQEGTGNQITNNIITLNGYKDLPLNSSYAAINLANISNSLIQGNFIGTDMSGANLGNSFDGIYLWLDTRNNNIISNTIAYNNGNGISLTSESLNYMPVPIDNTISRNSVYANKKLGINLGAEGATLNDNQDSDVGGNGQQNFPTFTTEVVNNLIKGVLNSVPNSQYKLEFFANETCDPSSYGEGETFVGSMAVTTDNTGTAAFTMAISDTADLKPFITVTATDSRNNTSEFARCAAADLVVSSHALSYLLLPKTYLTYTITISNNGPLTATGVVLTNTLSPFVKLVSISTTKPNVCSGETKIICNVGTFSTADKFNLIIVVKADSIPRILDNFVTVTGIEPDSNTDNNFGRVITFVSNGDIYLPLIKK